jgi:hypothetical protein
MINILLLDDIIVPCRQQARKELFFRLGLKGYDKFTGQ